MSQLFFFWLQDIFESPQGFFFTKVGISIKKNVLGPSRILTKVKIQIFF